MAKGPRLFHRRADLPRPAPDAAAVALALGAGRVVIGLGFLAAPTVAVRLLGVDAASAKRMTFLARMAAARDIGLGGGTIAARSGPGVVAWLVAAAAADAVDAVAITRAVRTGPAGGPVAYVTAAGAAAAVPAGLWAALRLRHQASPRG